MKKKLALIFVLGILVIALSACSINQADKVASNISKEADNFNVVRRLTVINMRSDSITFELIGAFSLSNNSAGELVVTCQTAPNEYKKHYVYINREWTTYVVEDLSGANVSPYQYEINFLPESILPITFTSSY